MGRRREKSEERKDIWQCRVCLAACVYSARFRRIRKGRKRRRVEGVEELKSCRFVRDWQSSTLRPLRPSSHSKSHPTMKIAVSTSAWLTHGPYSEPVFSYIQAQIAPPIATATENSQVSGDVQPK